MKRPHTVGRREDESSQSFYKAIIKNYVKTRVLPSVDTLLDCRHKLANLRINDNFANYIWYDHQIKAVDLLLDKHI